MPFENLPDILKIALPIAAMVLAGVIFLLMAIKWLLYICPPNEVLIFSGRRHRTADGAMRGFRLVFGGRGWKMPIFEKVDRLSLNTIEVPISIRGAYAQGGIPLNVDAVANVKISSDEVVVGNAIERFLGQNPNEIKRVAKETLEGHLRGVLARLTPEEVNEDRLKFAEELSRESELDLSKLGIHLDTFKVQHVSDETGYLDSIGREAIANVIRSAEMAESDAKRVAEQIVADSEGRGQVALSTAEANIAKLKNELRKIQADLESNVKAEEERTQAAAREARAKAEQELQQIRANLEAVRLQVDQVLPAEADKVAQEYRARAEAAPIRERGLAVSESLSLLHQAWAEAGPSAQSIFLIEDLEKILATAAQGVHKVKVQHLNMIDTGDGKTLSNYVSAYPAMLSAIFQAVNETTGIDIPKSISSQVEEKK
ncbi:MAG TPA: SPFH domain-containing protein [Fimbriimonadaceae bacterium]|nr:SPFH domain-containing protein [Fimbriimonadaceae bacterium]